MCEEKESYAFVSYEVGLSVNRKPKKTQLILKNDMLANRCLVIVQKGTVKNFCTYFV